MKFLNLYFVDCG